MKKNNRLLLKYYNNNLNVQIERIKRGANKNVIMELSRFIYIIYRLEEENNRSIKQLEDEGLKYANEVISAGNKLAAILGITPLE